MSHLMGPVGSSYTYKLSSQPCPLLSPKKTKAISRSAGSSEEAHAASVKEEHASDVEVASVKEEHASDVEVYCGLCGRQFAQDFIRDARIPTVGCEQRVYLYSCFQKDCRPARNLPERQTINLTRAARYTFVEDIKQRGSTALRPAHIRLIPTPGDSGPEGHPEEEVDNRPQTPPCPPPAKKRPRLPRWPPPKERARHIDDLRPVVALTPTPSESGSEGHPEDEPRTGQSEWQGKRPPGMPPMMKFQGVQVEQNENAEDVELEVYCARCGRQFAPDFIKDVGISTKGGDQSRKSCSLFCCYQVTCKAAENLPPRRIIMPTAEERSNFQSGLRNWGSKALMDHEGGERHEEEDAKSPKPEAKPKAKPITGKRKRDEVCPRPLSKTAPLVVQLVTAGWRNLHDARDTPIDAEPAPKWEKCPSAADMEAQLKRLVCPQALQACQPMCCVIVNIYIYIYMYIRRLPYGVRFGPPSYIYLSLKFPSALGLRGLRGRSGLSCLMARMKLPKIAED